MFCGPYAFLLLVWLEEVLQGELHDAWIACGAGDLTEGAAG